MADSLATYRSKRHFDHTPEPRGEGRAGSGSLYTIQKHAARRLHYDLRLELDGVLKSWAVTKGPSLDPGEKRLAVRVEDHPLEYAEFEGSIPAGNYGAGTVLLWDKGAWEPIGDPHEGLANGKLVFNLHGQRLLGRWALVRFRGRQDAKRENWLLIKEKDEHARRDEAITDTAVTSVASGRDMDAVAAAPDAVWDPNRDKPNPKRPRQGGAAPGFVRPALATLVDKLPAGPEWLFEVKFDGYRALAAVAGDQVRIDTRNGLDWTARYPSVAQALRALDLDRALLDGEIVAVDEEGRSNFGALQQALTAGGAGLTYFVFDLLSLAGSDLRDRPLVERKEKLRKLLAGVPRSGPIAFADHIEDGAELFQTMCRKSFEGVIAKRSNSRYRSGRGHAWLKIKCNNQREFVIVGWSTSTADRPFGSILLAEYRDGALRYAGRVGSGFSRADLAALADRFGKLKVSKSPVAGTLPSGITRNARWLKPELVAEVAYTEVTREGIVRHGRFLGLREDKLAQTVQGEQPRPVGELTGDNPTRRELPGIRLTHPDKVLFAADGITKRDVALYLDAAAGRMLPHLANRPLSLLRHPEGIAHEGFFQRHAGRGTPAAIKRFPATGNHGKAEEFLTISDKQGLLAAAQMGVLEFHIWGVHVDDLERPDRLVFDLDPDPSIGFGPVRDAAADIHAALDALGLVSFALLSGGKGVHVVVPIVRDHPWPTIKRFAKALAERFAEEMPDRYVATMTKARRAGRIFIDHFRNERTASAIAPYSPRARDGAPVAWPVTWPELAHTDSAALVSVRTAVQRLAAPDPWADYSEVRQRLSAKALRALGVKD